MLLRAKIFLSKDGGEEGSNQILFETMLNRPRNESCMPDKLTSIAIKVILKETIGQSQQDLKKLLDSLERCNCREIKDYAVGSNQLSSSLLLSDNCELHLKKCSEMYSKCRRIRTLCGTASLSLNGIFVNTKLPSLHLKMEESEGKTISLFAIFLRTPSDLLLAKHSEMVEHFVGGGEGLYKNVNELGLGRRSSPYIVKTPFQSHFKSRNQLLLCQKEQLSNMGFVESGEVNHFVTPLFSASNTVMKHLGVQFTLVSIMI
jgi:hypothetical protein